MMDGIAATKAVRLNSSNVNLNIVGLSSHSDENTLGMSKEAGMNSFIVKPFTVADFHTAVQHHYDRLKAVGQGYGGSGSSGGEGGNYNQHILYDEPGSVVTSLPRGTGEETRYHAPMSSTLAGRKLRVLVVDDAVPTRKLTVISTP
jgi:PleD family two-component response regulator